MRNKTPQRPPVLPLFALILVICAVGPLHLQATELRRTAIVRAIESSRKSIVNIQGRKKVRDDQPRSGSGDGSREVNGMGTGVVVDERGYIVTNHHVVDGVARIQVTLDDGRVTVARILAHDSSTDLAILKVSIGEKLPVISVGRSHDLMIGEPVIAVGNAFGYEHTVTRGIVSALKRTVQVSDTQKYHDLIQTDASINPGNSGGPLLNIDGDMIGINVAVRVGAQGIGFAIPIDEAMEIMARLLSIEQTKRLRHGIVGSTQSDGEGLKFQIRDVLSDTPARRAGFLAGDVVTQVQGQSVHRWMDFERALLDSSAGDEISVRIERKGSEEDLSLSIAKARPVSQKMNDLAWDVLGLQLAPVPHRDFRRLTSQYRGGLKIVSVRVNGPAAKQGIRSGDVLVGMHEWETISLENVSYILSRSGSQKLHPLKFYILRGHNTLFGYLRVARRSK